MIRKDLEKLLKHIEPQVMGILISHGLVTSKNLKFSDLQITTKGKNLIGQSDPVITDEFIDLYRSKFPSLLKGNKNTVREKLNVFLMENEVTLEKILEAVDLWISTRDSSRYVGKADNFIYLNQDGVRKSRLMECIEALEEENDLIDTGGKFI